MLRNIPILLLLLFSLNAFGQKEERLPADLRQHNLTTYNASLFNPAFSFDRNNPESIALWARWQWQGIDSNPTTMFLNYTRKLDDRSAAGAAFFQQNTGIFFNTGGALNYSYKFDFSSTVKLAVGLNAFAFKQTLADDRFQTDPNVPLPLPTVADDFIIQMAPGASLSVERLTLSLASENLIDYNFTAKESNTEKEDKIFMSILSYDFPITLGAARNAFLRPSMYLRTIPGQSNQVGFYTLLNTNKYYGQVGYNNFYGYALGIGGTVFKNFSLGALVEFGTGASINTESSFELMAAYFLGKPDDRHKVVGFDIEEENVLLELEQQKDEQEEIEEESEKADDIEGKEKAAEKLAKEEEKKQRKREKSVQDSIAKVEKDAALIVKQDQKKLDKETKEKTKKEDALAEAKEKELQETIAEELEKTVEVVADEKAAEKIAKEEEKLRRKQEKAAQDSIAQVEKDAAIAAKELQKQLEEDAKERAKKEEAQAQAKEKVQREPIKELEKREEVVPDEKATEKVAKEKEKLLRKQEKAVQDSIAKVEKDAAIAAKELQKQLDIEAKEQAKKEDALAEVEAKEQKRKKDLEKEASEEDANADAQGDEQTRKMDSVNEIKKAEALTEAKKVAQKRKQDSLIAAAQEARRKTTVEARKKAEQEKIVDQNNRTKPETGEKYEEVVSEAGMLPGYYLIANVFRTKKYFDAFMSEMKKKGLEPRGFIRSKNKFTYVYLSRYRTLKEARQGRDSNIKGKYSGKTWIFRVIGD